MKTIKLELDYPEKEYRTQDKLDNDGNVIERGRVIPGGKKKLSLNLLYTGFNGKYASGPSGQGGGMTREELRMWSKIQDKLDDADKEIELSDEQFDLVWKVMTEYNFPPAFARVHDRFLEHLEELKITKKTKEK